MVLWRWEDGLPGKGWSGQLLPAAVSVRDRTGEGDLGPTCGMIGVRLGALPETRTSWWGLELPGLFAASSWDGLDSGLQGKASPASVGAFPTVGQHPLLG